MTKDVKKALCSIAIVVMMLAGVDYATEWTGQIVLKNLPLTTGSIPKDNYRLNTMTSDIVILGSSRGKNHYDTHQLGDSINNYTHGDYTIYNASINARGIYNNTCAAMCIMERYSPKLIILEVIADEFDGIYETDMQFELPQYINHKPIRNFIEPLSWKERVKARFALYRFNNTPLRFAAAYVEPVDSCGFVLDIEELSDSTKTSGASRTPTRKPSPIVLAKFREMLQTCNEKHIPIVIASSPHLKPFMTNELLEETCAEFGVPYINLFNVEYFNNNYKLFHDRYHLNEKGAHKYGEMFFEELKPYLTPLMNEN